MAVRLHKNFLQNNGVHRLSPITHRPPTLAITHYCSLLLLPTNPHCGLLAMAMGDGSE